MLKSEQAPKDARLLFFSCLMETIQTALHDAYFNLGTYLLFETGCKPYFAEPSHAGIAGLVMRRASTTMKTS